MLKNLARRILPKKVWTRLQSTRATGQLRQLEDNWKHVRGNLGPISRPDTGLNRILIVPSDPRWLTGSCGDEAMINAIKHMAMAVNPDVEIHILVEGPKASQIAEAQGMISLDIWSTGDFVHPMMTAMCEHAYAAVVAMGADVIDGFYGSAAPSKLLVSVDLAARLGIPAAVLGASFSTKPDVRLKPFFDGLDPRVHLCIRDAISLARCQAFTTARSELVADSAFMLQTPDADAKTMGWVNARRAEGKQVVGFNIHPMLLPNIDDDPEALLIKPAFDALLTVTADSAVAWLLIPHDRREDCGDNSVLNPLFARLKERLGNDVELFGGHRSAAELKAMAGAIDGVVTGRMHLAIASLGKGTPVLCVTYQDKFEGLLNHFDLPHEALLSLEQLNDPHVFVKKIQMFLSSITEMRQMIADRRPQVLGYSKRNFVVFAEYVRTKSSSFPHNYI